MSASKLKYLPMVPLTWCLTGAYSEAGSENCSDYTATTPEIYTDVLPPNPPKPKPLRTSSLTFTTSMKSGLGHSDSQGRVPTFVLQTGQATVGFSSRRSPCSNWLMSERAEGSLRPWYWPSEDAEIPQITTFTCRLWWRLWNSSLLTLPS